MPKPSTTDIQAATEASLDNLLMNALPQAHGHPDKQALVYSFFHPGLHVDFLESDENQEKVYSTLTGDELLTAQPLAFAQCKEAVAKQTTLGKMLMNFFIEYGRQFFSLQAAIQNKIRFNPQSNTEIAALNIVVPASFLLALENYLKNQNFSLVDNQPPTETIILNNILAILEPMRSHIARRMTDLYSDSDYWQFAPQAIKDFIAKGLQEQAANQASSQQENTAAPIVEPQAEVANNIGSTEISPAENAVAEAWFQKQTPHCYGLLKTKNTTDWEQKRRQLLRVVGSKLDGLPTVALPDWIDEAFTPALKDLENRAQKDRRTQLLREIRENIKNNKPLETAIALLLTGTDIQKPIPCKKLEKVSGQYSSQYWPWRTSFLHYAALVGCTDIVELLLSGEEDVNRINADKETPLHIACERGHEEMAKLFIRHDAYVNAVGEKNRTPLHCAMYAKQNKLAIITLLLDNHARINAVDKDGNQPIHLTDENVEIINLLLARGGDINALGRNGTLLHFAAGSTDSDSQDFIDYLFEMGANLQAGDQDGKTPLHIASLENTSFLLRRGAAVNATDADGNTPLHDEADDSYELEKVKLLLAEQADINLQNKRGETPLHLAPWREGEGKMTALLLEHGARVDIQDNKKRSALHAAVGYNNQPAVALLIEKGADINLRDEDGNTPLHLAVGWADIASRLIEKGAKVDLGNNKGDTPLHLAAEKGEMRTVQLLLEHGAQPTLKNNQGKTPAQCCREMTSNYWDQQKRVDIEGSQLIFQHLTEVDALLQEIEGKINKCSWNPFLLSYDIKRGAFRQLKEKIETAEVGASLDDIITGWEDTLTTSTDSHDGSVKHHRNERGELLTNKQILGLHRNIFLPGKRGGANTDAADFLDTLETYKTKGIKIHSRK